MDNHSEQKNTKEAVLAKIREKSIGMRPKWYFTFDVFLAVLVSLVILTVSIALVSFIFFSLRVGGHESLLSFGPRGVILFLAIFPWPLLLLDILLILFLETLLRRFKFGYRSPVLYLLIGLLTIAGAAGVALDRGTHVNDLLLERADHGGLPPPFGEVYERVHVGPPREQGIFRGIVNSVSTSSFTMTHDDFDHDGNDNAIYMVIPPSGFSSEALTPGDRVYVAGDEDGTSSVRAYGIRDLSK